MVGLSRCSAHGVDLVGGNAIGEHGVEIERGADRLRGGGARPAVSGNGPWRCSAPPGIFFRKAGNSFVRTGNFLGLNRQSQISASLKRSLRRFGMAPKPPAFVEPRFRP
jgi:hypothetical protein